MLTAASMHARWRQLECTLTAARMHARWRQHACTLMAAILHACTCDHCHAPYKCLPYYCRTLSFTFLTHNLQDRGYVTATEWRTEWGGYKGKAKVGYGQMHGCVGCRECVKGLQGQGYGGMHMCVCVWVVGSVLRRAFI